MRKVRISKERLRLNRCESDRRSTKSTGSRDTRNDRKLWANDSAVNLEVSTKTSFSLATVVRTVLKRVWQVGSF